MISRRCCVQRLFTIRNSVNINHLRWWIRPLMALTSTFSVGPKDSFKGFQFLSTSIDPQGGKYPFNNVGLLGTCCSFNDANVSCAGNSNKYMNGFHPAQVFVPPHPLLLHDDVEEASTSKPSDTDNNSSHRGNSAGFFNQDLHDKIVVAVDVDEVLGNFVSALNEFIADRYSSYHSVSEYHVYEFFKIWKCSRDEADIRVHEFFKTSYFKTGIRPIPGAQQTLQKLSRFCNLSIVTSRQNAIKDHTIEWIERHYPGLFQDMHFGNHFALNGKSIAKSDICRSLGANVLIDDNPRYAIECAEVGIKVLLFDYENSYPWSKSESLNGHPMVKKVHNWGEVEHQLTSWIVPRNFSPR
ncbi:putative lariat debranching enzyme-like isoform X1 [Capsicum annuum]|nr:putative lariat debranching enzyme-like isoform X1 [Capsicum annuum]KAF3647945.1 putative lariat debranching enzyme-like isoform X1 [Capsicum annuum]